MTLFTVEGGMWTGYSQSTYLPPLAIASPHTSLHCEQYVICSHIAQKNEIFIILTRDFSKEQCVLPEDDMRYAIETCRSILSVLA